MPATGILRDVSVRFQVPCDITSQMPNRSYSTYLAVVVIIVAFTAISALLYSRNTLAGNRTFQDQGRLEVSVRNNDNHLGTLSASIESIVFVSLRDSDGDTEIFVMNADGSGQTQLTHNSVNDYHPRWSPDGGKIAFERSLAFQDTEIFVMDANGTNEVQLTNSVDGSNVSPDWSPDGKRIVFASTRPDASGTNSQIYVINADGSGETRLTSSNLGAGTPNWSPNGTKIMFHRGSGIIGVGTSIWSMSSSGGGETKLTNDTNDLQPRWAPNGSTVLFKSYRNGGSDIYKMSSDGSGQVALTNDHFPKWAANFSYDMTKIVFQHGDANDQSEIYTMGPNGENPTPITNNSFYDGEPDWGLRCNTWPVPEQDTDGDGL